MAGAKGLRYGVMVRNPETLEATVLVAGTKKSDVPDWAKELVHDDDFGSVDAPAPSEPSTPEPPADTGYAGMKPEDLAAEAEKRELTVTGTGANGNVKKGDLVAALEAHDAAQAGA